MELTALRISLAPAGDSFPTSRSALETSNIVRGTPADAGRVPGAAGLSQSFRIKGSQIKLIPVVFLTRSLSVQCQKLLYLIREPMDQVLQLPELRKPENRTPGAPGLCPAARGRAV